MRVLHVTNSLSGGGAAIAAKRIFEATRTQPGVDAHLVTTSPLPEGLNDPRITYFEPKNQRLNIKTEAAALRLQKSINPAHRTVGLFPSGLADHILRRNWDLIHLHWVGLGTLSIKEIGQISSAIPTVWTLHDSWPFCGADHHPHFEHDDRFIAGYTPNSRLPQDSRYDLDAAVFRAKQRHWRSPIALIAPSTFMAENAQASKLAHDWPLTTIPHPLDSSVFHPINQQEKEVALRSAGLDPEKPVALFVSSPGGDFSKGLDLLETTFKELRQLNPHAQLTTIGGPWPQLGSDVLQLPKTSNERELACLYAAANVVIVPSRIESFSLVAAEAQASGTTVIAFDTSGLRDVLAKQEPETRIPQWDAQELAIQVQVAIEDTKVSSAPRSISSQDEWHPETIGRAYVNWYEYTRGKHCTVTIGNPKDSESS